MDFFGCNSSFVFRGCTIQSGLQFRVFVLHIFLQSRKLILLFIINFYKWFVDSCGIRFALYIWILILSYAFLCRYLDAGRDMLASLQYGTRCPCGYCHISDVEHHKQEDHMESFFLAETVRIYSTWFWEHVPS